MIDEDRFAQLERRVAALESNAKPAGVNTGRQCKQCGGTNLIFIATKPHEHFGIFGDTNDLYRCAQCGLGSGLITTM